MTPRWLKLWRDVRAERGRIALMIIAITASLAGVGAVLASYSVLTREVTGNYRSTRPASVTLELPGGIDAATSERVRAFPRVTAVEARETLSARVRVREGWRHALLFVIDDFARLQLNTFRREAGEWPPPRGSMLIERTALGMAEASLGEEIEVLLPGGTAQRLKLSGVVHDPGLAPAWQERSVYGYVTRETAALLGAEPRLTELRVELGAEASLAEIETDAQALAASLTAEGQFVEELRIPPPRAHPHERQMRTVMTMLMLFTVLALVLSSVLVANSLSALLARQVREIALLKTLGASAGDVTRLYVVLIGAIGLLAVVLASPLAVVLAQSLIVAVSRLLNLELASRAIPAWVFAVMFVAGVLTPLVAAALPISSASRRTVRAALDDHGVSTELTRRWSLVLPPSIRNLLRRPARLALTLTLLTAGGAMAISAIQVKRGWEANVAKVFETRRYDVEVLLAKPIDAARASELRAVPGVREVEAWPYAPAAFSRPGQADVVRTYPDRGHGTLVMMGLPRGTTFINFPLREGRWLNADDARGVVLNHSAAAMRPGVKLGDEIELSAEGRRTRWTLVGVVEEIGAAGVAYVDAASFERELGAGARVFRVLTDAETPSARQQIIAQLERVLIDARAPVDSIQPLAELRTAMGDHVLVLVQLLLAMAVVFAIVGVLGLVSSMSVTVIERTRELGVLKTLGATPAAIRRMLLTEALVTTTLSTVTAFVVSIGITSVLDRIVGMMGFVAPLPLVLSPAAIIGWVVLALVAASLATLAPANAAARLRIQEALGRT
ncbi:MAG: FtsX-like permease family protein [Archangium sp.]